LWEKQTLSQSQFNSPKKEGEKMKYSKLAQLSMMGTKYTLFHLPIVNSKAEELLEDFYHNYWGISQNDSY